MRESPGASQSIRDIDTSVCEGSKKNVNDGRVVYIGHDQISTTEEHAS